MGRQEDALVSGAAAEQWRRGVAGQQGVEPPARPPARRPAGAGRKRKARVIVSEDEESAPDSGSEYEVSRAGAPLEALLD